MKRCKCFFEDLFFVYEDRGRSIGFCDNVIRYFI